MITIIATLLSLVVSGLAFITYKHPVIARNLIKSIYYISWGIWILTIAFLFGEYNGFTNSIYATQTSNWKAKTKNIDLDSLNHLTSNKDSIINLLKANSFQVESELKQLKVEKEITDSIQFKINSTKTETLNSTSWYLWIGVTAIIILTIFLILSYIFEKMWKQESIKSNTIPSNT